MFYITTVNFAIKAEIREINKIKKFESVLSKLPWFENWGAPRVKDFMKPKRTFIAKIKKAIAKGLIPLKSQYYTFETDEDAKNIYKNLKSGWRVIWYYIDCE